MKTVLRGVTLLILLAFGLYASAGPVDFSREVLPVLSDSCFQCHGPDANARKAKLRLDVEADAKAERDGVFAIKPGEPENSEIIARMLSHDPDDKMPPPDLGRGPSQQQIKTVSQWIQEGAVWGKHWSFNRVERPAPPAA
ncbi:MAG: c-type cytochrome domain-containing protein, partial [Verrucomicrobiota bacterium]